MPLFDDILNGINNIDKNNYSSEQSISFMNDYHNSNDLNYAKTLSSDDWNEHIINSQYIKSDEDEKKKFEDIMDNSKFKTKDMTNMLSDSTLSSPEDMLENRFNKFSRYGYLDPAHEFVTGSREYLFFSKPDLHLINVDTCADIYDVLQEVPFFNEAFNRYKLSYYSLQQTFNTKTYVHSGGVSIDLRNKYINLLSNMVTSSFDLSDISSSDVLNNQNIYQVNTSYREGSLSSDLQHEFSLEFKDTKYLDVYMLFKIYDEYFRYKYMLEIMPTRYEYIFNKIYPEALSIWKIIVDDTGRIMYWAKATGCYPLSVPRGTLSNIEGNIKFTINWKAQFIKDMDPINLTELNYLTARSLGIETASKDITRSIINKTKKIYSLNDTTTWVGYPLIIPGSIARTGQHINNNDSDISKYSFHRLVWVNK